MHVKHQITWLMRIFMLLLPQDLTIRYYHLMHGCLLEGEAKTGAYRFQLDKDWFTLDANLLRQALEITPIDQAQQFMSPPSDDAIMDFVNELGYPEEIHFVSRMAVNNLYQPWRAILLMINQCLTAIQTFLVYKANLSMATKKDKKTKPHVIPYFQFTKLIICYLGRKHNLHQRLESPLNLAEDDYRLGNLKQYDECTPYYNAYLEMVAKHDRKTAAEKRGKMKSGSKADQSKKPATAKQPKPVPSKPSKPAPAKKPKVVQEKPLEPLPAKQPKRSVVRKVHKRKNPLQLVDEEELAQP
ncbi:hypothetical protein Tco_1403660 [Tanacetum coccineum]